MEWLWLIQLMLNLAFGVIVWHLWLGRRAEEAQRRELMHESVSREDFEEYQRAMGELCDRLERESEKWCRRLDEQTKRASERMQELQERPRQKSAPVAESEPFEQPRRPVVAGVVDRYSASAERRADAGVEQSVPDKALGVDERVRELFRQGCSVEQIARKLHLGQREVHLLLNFKRP